MPVTLESAFCSLESRPAGTEPPPELGSPERFSSKVASQVCWPVMPEMVEASEPMVMVTEQPFLMVEPGFSSTPRSMVTLVSALPPVLEMTFNPFTLCTVMMRDWILMGR